MENDSSEEKSGNRRKKSKSKLQKHERGQVQQKKTESRKRGES